MSKKFFITALIFSLICIIASPIFASNIMDGAGNTLNNIKGGIQNIASDAGDAMGRAKDGMQNMMNDAKGDENDAAKDTEGMMNGENGDDTQNRMSSSHGDYTASRTSADSSINSARSTFNTTLWIIFAILGIAIVALTWYYGAQFNNTDKH